MRRIFSIRLNLDDMMASTEFLEGDAAFADWLRGFRVGSRGGPCRWGGGSPGADGYTIGANALAEAQGFQVKKSEGGKKSAKVRKEKHGTNSPRSQREDTSKTHQAMIKDSSKSVPLDPQDTSNQTLIVNRVNSKGENEEPFIDPAEQNYCQPETPAKRKPAKAKPAHDELGSVPGLKMLRPNRAAWEALLAEVGIDNLRQAVRECLAAGQECYQDRVTPYAMALKRERDNPPDDCPQGEELPADLNNLPLGHPARRFIRKHKAAECPN